METPAITVIGASGQVAKALARAAHSRGETLVCFGRPAVDIADSASLSGVFQRSKPALVINAAAYTAVDKAESEPDAARTANELGPAHLAALCCAHGVPLIHISTDYVFDGRATVPYTEDDQRAPINVYGHTKSAGEDAIRAVLPQHIIVRTAWVYGPDGQNFLKTMLRLGAERDVLRVVADQHGTPTSADDLAVALLDIARAVLRAGDTAAWGTYHAVGVGQTTWHGFAHEIFRQAAEAGLQVPKLEAIETAAYPAPAARPRYSVLDTDKLQRTFGIALPPWQYSLAQCFKTPVPSNT
jgi:dTDP-4-dehydrorhamnose reductase